MNTALLTIDDVSSKNTPALVDYLAEKGIKPLLFATGENVLRYYEEAKYALSKGMIIGNHSFSHPAFSDISFEEGIRDIEKCEEVLNKLYADCGIIRKYRPFRFPYGNKGGENRQKYQAYLKENGFHKLKDDHILYPWWKPNKLSDEIDTFWTFDFEEYKIRRDSGFTYDDVLKKMHDPAPEYGAALFGENNRHFILMHDHFETEEMLPGYYRLFVEHLIKNGIVFDEPEFE